MGQLQGPLKKVRFFSLLLSDWEDRGDVGSSVGDVERSGSRTQESSGALHLLQSYQSSRLGQLLSRYQSSWSFRYSMLSLFYVNLSILGLLVPDLPLELTHEVREACEKQGPGSLFKSGSILSFLGLELVLLVTPMTPKERMEEIANRSQGFVYLVSVAGVTGMRSSLNTRLQQLITELHETTEKSVQKSFIFCFLIYF